jgi:hypothetical protein
VSVIMAKSQPRVNNYSGSTSAFAQLLTQSELKGSAVRLLGHTPPIRVSPNHVKNTAYRSPRCINAGRRLRSDDLVSAPSAPFGFSCFSFLGVPSCPNGDVSVAGSVFHFPMLVDLGCRASAARIGCGGGTDRLTCRLGLSLGRAASSLRRLGLNHNPRKHRVDLCQGLHMLLALRLELGNG